ncbi:hypothetical protein [Rickettsia canadensis]|uniref:hypothetical protein n=1 Tax=Rickettsia canadensis TaxID=788 RepID=UPI001E4099C9|nr:hypothetical protein [Rickettsia canadensis]
MLIKNKAKIKTDILELIDEKWNIEQPLNSYCRDLSQLYSTVLSLKYTHITIDYFLNI